MSTPPDLTIRPARRDEQRLVRRMIARAHLDPTSLKWRNFLLAELDGRVVGCSQIKPYPDCRELGSLLVDRSFRRRGIAGTLIRALLAGESGEIYLMCRDVMLPYYAKFGFKEISPCDAPRTIKRKLRFTGLFRVLFGIRIVAMRRRPG